MADLYVPLDVNAPDDPKIVAAGDRAELVFYRSLCLAKRMMEDGFIAREHQRRLGASKRDVDALVRTGLWVEVPGGWTIPSFPKRNKTRKQIEQQRKEEAERKRAWRRAQQLADVPADEPVASGGTEIDATDSEVTCSDVNISPRLETSHESRYEAAVASLVKKRMNKPNITNPDGFRAHVTGEMHRLHGDRIRSLLDEFPDAPGDVIAAHIDGESSSLRYYKRAVG